MCNTWCATCAAVHTQLDPWTPHTKSPIDKNEYACARTVPPLPCAFSPLIARAPPAGAGGRLPATAGGWRRGALARLPAALFGFRAPADAPTAGAKVPRYEFNTAKWCSIYIYIYIYIYMYIYIYHMCIYIYICIHIHIQFSYNYQL